MKKQFLLLIGSIFLIIQCNDLKKPALEITYVANEGFMLQSGTDKIVIDVLFHDYYPFFAAPSEKQTKDLIEGNIPFDNIDLVLTTHIHRDHISPEVATDFLKTHDQTAFISTVQTFNMLRDFDSLNLRGVKNISLQEGETFDTVVNDIPVKIIRLAHLFNPEGDEENYGYLLDFNGIHVFHYGDAGIDVRSNKSHLEKLIEENRIDIMFHWYLDTSAVSLQFIREKIRPGYIIPMHIPPSQIFEIAEEYKTYDFGDAGIVFFYSSMEKYGFGMENDKLSVETLNSVPMVTRQVHDTAFLNNQPFQMNIPHNSFNSQVCQKLSFDACLVNGDPLPSWLKFDKESISFSGTSHKEQTVKIRLTASEKDGDKAITDFKITFTGLTEGEENIPDLKEGISCSYYIGEWDSLPDFNMMNPVKNENLKEITIPAEQSKDNFGISFKGYINITEDGIYCFYLRSDDGSELFVDDRLLISNDGLHDNQIEQRGYAGLKKGMHLFEILYFEKGMDQCLDLSYSGPGISKRKIPGNVLYYTKN